MQIHALIIAFALSLLSLVAAQSPTAAVSPIMSATPAFSGEGNSGIDGTSASVVSESHHGPSSSTVIGAAVGGSLAVSLLVLAGALFCLRYRVRKTRIVGIEGAADANNRCAVLEGEVLALREQVDRLVAHRLEDDGKVAYIHEKHVKELGDGTEKEAKGYLPTYAE
ncbi:hypothetical protein C8R46DRAFT_1065307 [Mycena filopes]|nr:hypothetical protein C8R46DRAFT_1065307 [Mycena filopes]